MPGKCSFREAWLQDEIRRKWLRSLTDDKYKAQCTFCKTTFDISHSGISAITSHEQGKKHKQIISGLLVGTQQKLSFPKSTPQTANIFTKDNLSIDDPPSDPTQSQISCSSQSGCSTSEKSSKTTSFINNFSVIESEILWTMFSVVNHLSARSSGKCSDVFPLMFTDSVKAQKFHMKKDKLSYFITYGLGPYFQAQLVHEINCCESYCISIDESMNKVAQKGQMDIIIRFWNSSTNEISTRYLSSAFLGRSTAECLLNSFNNTISDLGLSLKKLLQISLDGPNVNLKFLKDFKYLMKSENPHPDDKEILDTGTCSLHLLHNCIKVAHNNSNWKINEFLRCLYYFFKDFPSRRAQYISATGSTLFPLKIITIRWVENSKVITRALKIVPFLKVYIAAVKSDPPDSKNFGTLREFLCDKFLISKLYFIQNVISELESFLIMFQSDKPLFPFLYTELFSIARSIGRKFLKKEIMNPIKCAIDFKKIDLRKLANHIPITAIDIGFGAASSCKTAKEVEIITFKRDCKNFLIDILEKILNAKSPLYIKFVKGATSLSPLVMLNECQRGRLHILLNVLINNNIIAPIEADTLKNIYSETCGQSNVKQKLKCFNWKVDKLDKLFFDIFSTDGRLPFFKFATKIFILFHGQAAVERSFSINKECLVENMNEDSLIAQRCIYSAVQSCGGIEKVPITKSMISEVRRSSRKRRLAIEEKSVKNKDSKNLLKTAKEDLVNLKEKKRKVIEQAEEETKEIENQIAEREKKIRLYM